MSEDNIRSQDAAAEELGLGKKHLGHGLAKLDLEQENYSDFIEQYNDLIGDAIEMSKCEHEDVSITCNPKILSDPAKFMLDADGASIEEGRATSFRATCSDCGKELPADLVVEVQRD